MSNMISMDPAYISTYMSINMKMLSILLWMNTYFYNVNKNLQLPFQALLSLSFLN